jgi:RNA polymerase sigma factor (TIGR02999 family)
MDAGAMRPTRGVTDALLALRDGEPGSMDGLVSVVYEQLKQMAHRQLGMEPVGHTLSTTALVHEAYLRLVDQTRVSWSERAQFFGVAAQCMRRVLLDHARRHQATRRGGAMHVVSVDLLGAADAGGLATADRADILVSLDEALQRLALLDARQAQVVECRFFGGLTEAETAEALGLTPRTIARDWVKARGWLYEQLSDDRP